MSLKDYHDEMRLRLEFHEWHFLAGEMASAGKLPVEKAIKFSEITNKLVVIADEQDPPINPEALSKFVGLDPESPPHVKTRYACYDEACSVWSRIHAAWRRSRKPP
jgi:hypothetical protein